MTTVLRDTAEAAIRAAIDEAATDGIQICTFALYFDHESPALSVCMDTKANSIQQVRAQNAYVSKYFRKSIDSGDLNEAALWQANVGGNLSLGDFARVNVGRTEVDHAELTDGDCVELIQTVIAHEREILGLAEISEDLLFCCSSPTDEVGIVWSAGSS